MVQIIEERKKPSFLEGLGKGLGKALGEFGEIVEEKKFREAYPELAKVPKAYRQIALQAKLRQDEQAKQLQGKQETMKADNKAMFSFGEKLKEQNPNNPLFSTIGDIYQLDINPDVKSKMVHDLTGADPFKMQQQRRLQLDSTLKRYSQRLKEVDSEIKNVYLPNSKGKDEVNTLKNQREALRKERDELLGFKSLMGMDDDDDYDEDFEEEEGEQPKVKFNQNNKQHRAKAEQLFKKYKDKEKVRKLLSKEFSF